MKKGFTLIEILVVVLIIGILAAIAIPQYQYAVLKTRYHTLMEITRSVKEAQERYYLQNGKYAEHFSELDLSFSKNADIGTFVIGNYGPYEAIFLDNRKKVVVLFFTQTISSLLDENGNRGLDFNLKLDNTNIWGETKAQCATWQQSDNLGRKLCKELSSYPETCEDNSVYQGRYSCQLY